MIFSRLCKTISFRTISRDAMRKKRKIVKRWYRVRPGTFSALQRSGHRETLSLSIIANITDAVGNCSLSTYVIRRESKFVYFVTGMPFASRWLSTERLSLSLSLSLSPLLKRSSTRLFRNENSPRLIISVCKSGRRRRSLASRVSFSLSRNPLIKRNQVWRHYVACHIIPEI